MRQSQHLVANKAVPLPQSRLTLRNLFIPVAFAGPPKTSLTFRELNFTRAGKMKWSTINTTNTSTTQSTGATALNKRSLRRNKNLALRREIACEK
jgi:hypothetical protein